MRKKGNDSISNDKNKNKNKTVMNILTKMETTASVLYELFSAPISYDWSLVKHDPLSNLHFENGTKKSLIRKLMCN